MRTFLHIPPPPAFLHPWSCMGIHTHLCDYSTTRNKQHRFFSVGELAWTIICMETNKILSKIPNIMSCANSMATTEITSNPIVKQVGGQSVLYICTVDFQLDKSLSLKTTLKETFSSHCQKNIITAYCLCSSPSISATCVRLGTTQPLSGFRTVPCLIFLLLQIFDTEPVRMDCLLFQFLCLSHFHSYHLLRCISFRKVKSFHSAQSFPCKQCPIPLFLPSSLHFIGSYFMLRSSCFKEFTLQTFLQG